MPVINQISGNWLRFKINDKESTGYHQLYLLGIIILKI